MNLKISLKSIYNNLGFTLLSIFVYIFIDITFGIDYSNPKYYPLIIFLSLPIIISVITFFDYLQFESKRLIIINHDMIKIEKKGTIREIYKEEIEEVKLFAAYVFYRNSSFRISPFEIFHHAEIITKDKQSVYITSLCDTELFYKIQKQPIFKGKITFKMSLFNSIIWHNLDKL